MKKIRRFPSVVVIGVALAGAAALSGCVAVPGGPGYTESVYSESYYGGGAAPVYVAPPSVYIEGGSYYQGPGYGYRRPYGNPYYSGPQPGYGPGPGYGPRPGYGSRPRDGSDRGPQRGDPRAGGPPSGRPPNQQPGAQGPGPRGMAPPPPRNGPPPQATRPLRLPQLGRGEALDRP